MRKRANRPSGIDHMPQAVNRFLGTIPPAVYHNGLPEMPEPQYLDDPHIARCENAMRKGRLNLRSPNTVKTPPAASDWKRYEPALRRYVQRRVPAQLVDDLVQEVWVRLYSLRDRSTILDMERYIFVVASSVLARHYRQNPVQDNIDQGALEFLKDELSPERCLAARQRIRNVMRVLEQLPARTRQVFVLHRFEEMTYQRIANDLAISVSAVEKHMIRALKALVESDGGR